MKKEGIDNAEMSELFSDMGISAPAFGEPQEAQTSEPELTGTEGFYQLPLRETSTDGKLKNVVPIYRRIKNSELNNDLIRIATKVLDSGYPMYTEVPFKHDGADYVARVEPHFREPGTGNGKPEGWHRGVSIYVRNAKPWNVGVFTRTPFQRPVDAPGSAPRPHLGEDIVVPVGTRVYPIGPGVVSETSTDGNAGNAVYVLHENGKVLSAYKHLSKINVSKGQKVTFNTVLGLSGESGNAKSPHLHYEVRVARSGTEGSSNRRDYVHMNPSDYIGSPIGKTTNKVAFIENMISMLNKHASIEALLGISE